MGLPAAGIHDGKRRIRGTQGKNLHSWCPPGRAVKLMNEINGNFGTWQGKKISMHDTPEVISVTLLDMLGEYTNCFTYAGYHFRPVGLASESPNAIAKYFIKDNKLGISAYTNAQHSYSWADFYAAAKGMEADVYCCLEDGKFYLPGDKTLFRYTGSVIGGPEFEKWNRPSIKKDQQELTPDARMTGEQIRTPRGSFYVTDMTREQMEAAGYGFHHQSEDGKYFIMGNGKDVFAVPSQREAKNRQSIKEQLDDVRRSRNENGPEKQAPKSWER